MIGKKVAEKRNSGSVAEGDVVEVLPRAHERRQRHARAAEGEADQQRGREPSTAHHERTRSIATITSRKAAA